MKGPVKRASCLAHSVGWNAIRGADIAYICRFRRLHDTFDCGEGSRFNQEAGSDGTPGCGPPTVARLGTHLSVPWATLIRFHRCDQIGNPQSSWQTRQIQLAPRNNSVALFMSPNWN